MWSVEHSNPVTELVWERYLPSAYGLVSKMQYAYI